MISSSICLIVTGLALIPRDAGSLARGRTQPPCELGEVVGGQQTIQRPPPLVPVHESFQSGMMFFNGQP